MHQFLAKSRFVLILVSVVWLATKESVADEGMWLFTDLPAQHLKSQFSFEPSEEWAEHIRLSSVRFNSGGSASFVSSNGLVITNHHVAADTLHKISTADNNYSVDGFRATSPGEEIKAPDLELNQLVSIEDVTAQVDSSVTAEMSTVDAFKARRARMAELEKKSLDDTGLRSDVVTLFGGAKYHLYRYKKYTDVRVVFAPESAIAAFGGDADNFEYPRYCLDFTIFRVYENGQPAKIDNFLKWSANGAGDGELVFVSGNPGRTQRIFTAAALKYLRDHRIPYVLNLLRRREIALQQFALDGAEAKRIANDDMLGVQNARKAYTGMIQGLQDPAFISSKEEQEKDLIAQLAANPDLRQYVTAWQTIEEVQQKRAEKLGLTAGFRSRLYDIAEHLVLMTREDTKPSGERLRDYRDSARESLELRLYSPAPIYKDFETAKLADSIALFVERRGADDPLVKQVLAGKSPNARAVELVSGTQLDDIAARKSLAEGGMTAVETADDPMIQLARMMESEYRRLDEIDEELDELQRQAYAQITEANIAINGTSGYPDATFTLRLAFGPVQGYEFGGQTIPPWTTLGGTFEHEQVHGQVTPWKLPESWNKAKDKMDLTTPYNFVCTADIIGGNSGSPVVNQAGEFVGIIFDGNIQSLTSDFFYSDQVARAVSVHSSAIREVLVNVYGAEKLAEQLGR